MASNNIPLKAQNRGLAQRYAHWYNAASAPPYYTSRTSGMTHLTRHAETYSSGKDAMRTHVTFWCGGSGSVSRVKSKGIWMFDRPEYNVCVRCEQAKARFELREHLKTCAGSQQSKHQ